MKYAFRGQLNLLHIKTLREQRTSFARQITDGVHALLTTLHASALSERVDKTQWHLCHRCRTLIPAQNDWLMLVDGKGIVRCDEKGRLLGPQALDTISYICPFCFATQLGSFSDNIDLSLQKNCHSCDEHLKEWWGCHTCGMLRGWGIVTCPHCQWRQAVYMPHVASSQCASFSLDCIECERSHVHKCLC